MSSLVVFLFGPPRVERNGATVEIHRRKVVALLAYLAVTGKPHSREVLTNLLWPKQDRDHARAGFRRSLSILKSNIGDEWLEIDRNNVGLIRRQGLWIDVEQFQDLVSGVVRPEREERKISPASLSMLTEAAELYRDGFLSGFYLNDSPNFDEWQLLLIELLRQRYSSILEALVDTYRTQGRLKLAIEYGRRWLNLDQLSEPVHRLLMQLYSLDGQRSTALRQYERCKSVLQQELDVLPEDETERLLEAIQARRATPAVRPKYDNGEQLWADDIRISTVLVADTGTPADSLERSEEEDRIKPEIAAILDRYEAFVDNALSGEVVAIFGHPSVHEDDVERALAASLKIRDAAVRLNMRVGIATGPLIVRTRDAVGKRAVSTSGTVIREATQLHYRARRDQILTDSVTYRRARGAFEFEPLQNNVSGFNQPAFEVIGSKSRPEKSYGIPGLKAPLTGRDDELQKLMVAVSEARAGRGQVALIIGEAGIGKSRLLAELRSHLLAPNRGKAPLLWLEGRCQESGMTTGYRPFFSALNDLFASEGDDAAAAVTANLRTMGNNGYLTEEQIDEIGPILGNLLGIHFGNVWDARLKPANPQEIKYRTFQALKELIVAVSKQKLLVLVLEDLHWADSLSMDLIAALMETQVDWPILLLCTFRPEWDAQSRRLSLVAARKCPDRYTEVNLRELNRRKSHKIFESLLHPNTISREIKELVVRMSQGNPFFLEETVRSLISTNAIYRDGETWQSRDALEAVGASEGILSITQARMDSLESAWKNVLQNGAVIGSHFEWSILKETCPSETNFEEAVLALENYGFIFEERSAFERVFAFKHDLVQHAVYQTIPPPRRRSIHRSTGDAIEKVCLNELQKHFERLAYHYEQSDDKKKAAVYLLKAGEKARRAYSNDEAVSFFQKAIALIENTELTKAEKEWKLEALMGIVKVYELAGNIDKAEKYCRDAVSIGCELKLPPREMVEIHLLYCTFLYMDNRYDELMDLARKGLSLLADDRECIEFVLINLHVAYAHLGKNEKDQWRNHLFYVEPFLKKLPYSEELKWGYVQISMAYASIKKANEALHGLADLRRKAMKIHDLQAVAASYANGCMWPSVVEGNFDRVLTGFQQSRDIYRRIGAKLNISLIDVCEGWLRLRLGEIDRAEECARRALELAVTIGYRTGISNGHIIIGTVSLCRGEFDKAGEAFARVAEIFRENDGPFGLAHALILFGRALLAQDKQKRAGDCFLEAIRCLGRGDPRYDLLPGAIGGLEEAIGDRDGYRNTCAQLQEELSDAVGRLTQWYLELNNPGRFFQEVFREDFKSSASPGWAWIDPLEGCKYEVGNGLKIQAANGRDLWGMNLAAPRYLREITGDFAAQVVCQEASEDSPAIGGVLLWGNERNYLRLDKGRWGREDVCLGGSLDGVDGIFSRGNLRSTRLHLRIEKVGCCIRALCSGNGDEWYLVGLAEFAESESLQLGLHAVGMIDRSIYHGAFPDGSAIRFEEFRIFCQ